ncbi:MAG: cysteine desulfurase family protein [bacterium]|nr:cysteine desulfurase family protein [bacterium]
MKRIYLDYAATTPVDPLVKKAMEPYFCQKFGNPSSLHFFGQEAMAAIDESREKIAKVIGANFREVIFTGSATEANNLALRGIIKGFRFQVLGFSNKNQKYTLTPNTQNLTPRIIVSAIEHESILETVRDLESEDVEVIYLPVDREGLVDLKKLKESLNERTVLVSIMYANNEIGTIQPISAIVEIVRKFRMQNAELRKNNSKFLIDPLGICLRQKHNSELATALPLLHTDAVQSFQYLDCDVNKLGVDLMTLSSHKIYGPKGAGALYIRNPKHEIRNSKQILNTKSQTPNKQVSNFDIRISNLQQLVKPIVVGGGQEFGFRSGTENVAAIVGFAKAVGLISNSRELENKRVKKLSDYFWKELKKINPKVQINGASDVRCRALGVNKLPNILNIYFPGKLSEDLLIKLDLAGVAVSGGSACSARASKPSYVLKSCGLAENRIKSSLRFSLGRFTTKAEIDEAIKRIGPVV